MVIFGFVWILCIGYCYFGIYESTTKTDFINLLQTTGFYVNNWPFIGGNPIKLCWLNVEDQRERERERASQCACGSFETKLALNWSSCEYSTFQNSAKLMTVKISYIFKSEEITCTFYFAPSCFAEKKQFREYPNETFQNTKINSESTTYIIMKKCQPMQSVRRDSKCLRNIQSE